MELTKPAPIFRHPLLNAAGSLGFSPDLRSAIPWEQFGAFVTNPISYRPRQPAHGQRMRVFSGGVLLHTGHTNPGFSKTLKRFGGRWSQAPLPVVVHLLADRPEWMRRMILKLETIENIAAVEIGFPADVSRAEAAEVLSGATGELSLVARVGLGQAVSFGAALIEAGASAVCLGPPRGTMRLDAEEWFSGRVYGPAVLPQSLQAVRALVRSGVPVIAGGGVYSHQDKEALLAAGALAVQVDTALWRGDWLERGG
jgi:dihydroorotate dehydrogenase (NAD+) catalytic subunit